MSVLRSGLLSSAVHATGLGVRLLFIMALVRWTSPEIVGLFGLAISIELVVVYLAGLEFHTFTARRFAKTGDTSKLRVLISSHRRLLAFTAPLASLIGVAAALLLKFTQDWRSLILLAALLAVGTVAQELGRYLNLARRPVESVVLSFLRGAAWQPLALPFLDEDPIHCARIFLLLWTCSTTVAAVWGAWLLRSFWWPLAGTRSRYLWRGLKESRAYYAVASASVIQGNIERFILQLMLGPAAVGIYSFYQMLSNTLVSIVQSAMLNIALPNILIRFRQRSSDRFEYLSHLRKRVLQICVLSGIAVCVLTVPLMFALSKRTYTSYWWILPILIISQVLIVWTQPIHLALYAAHHDRLLVWLMTSALGASLVFGYVLVGWIALQGAVVAPILVSLFVAATRIHYMNRLRKQGIL